MSQSPFDPFDHHSIEDEVNTIARTASPRTIASKSTNTTNKQRTKSPALEGELEQSQSSRRALPPRLDVRLTLHEEVSSTAVSDPDGNGVSFSQLSIEGKVFARVECSNANKNCPFTLEMSGPMVSLATITCKDHCVLEDEDATVGGTIGTVRCRVDIPKSESAGCEILTYSMNVRTPNMPILIQAKSSLDKSDVFCISVQIRSNLSNRGPLSDLLVVVAIPPTTVRGETLRITRGDRGVWDSNKRVASWRVGDLPHGESRLLGAEAEVSEGVARLPRGSPLAPGTAEGAIRCPVLVRCSSEADQVSDLTLRATASRGVPATIVEHQARSYRLLHRVGKNEV